MRRNLDRERWFKLVPWLVIAAAVVSSFGCAGPTQGVGPLGLKRCDTSFYVYPKDTDPAQLEAFRDSFNYINEAVGMQLFVDGGPVADVVEPGDGYIVLKFADRLEADPDLVEKYGTKTETCGHTDYSFWPHNLCINSSVILLSRNCEQWTTDAGYRSIIRHEIGHALGLTHTDNPRDLMFEKYEWVGVDAKVFSAEELAAVRELYGAAQ